LTTGGTVIVPSTEAAGDPRRLIGMIAEQQATHVLSVPSLYERLLSEAQPEEMRSLQMVVSAGETCRPDLVKRHADLLGDTPLFNEYGPTEATVWSTVHSCAASSDQEAVPIGRPIANTQVYLLDRHLNPVPVGVSGEIYIGGAGVARGYLNRPELTAEWFVPDPYSSEPGARLYRTGDLGRWLADGEIVYLGRVDAQVKVRGYRIEPGEIEAALLEHSGVQEAVVCARGDGEGNSAEKRLVGYVVCQKEPTPSVSELRTFLKDRLPEYMVPSAFVYLDVLPLTPNGKVDRSSLPDVDASRPSLSESYVAPRNPVEEVLAGIWREMLGLEQVGVHDNFFELGGDSILSIQVMARCHQAGLQLTPRQLFQHQTIAELAPLAGEQQPAEQRAEQGLVTGPVPLIPIQRWFFSQEFDEPHHFNQSLLFSIDERLDRPLLENAIEHLLAHHDALRLRFERTVSGWEQRLSGVEGETPVVWEDLSGLSEAEQARAIEEISTELQSSLDLGRGPLMRVAYFDLGSGRAGRLLWIIHHLAVDGVSWRILLEDLQTVYRQLSRGENVALAPKTSSFKEWSERIVEYAGSAAILRERDYWLGHIEREGTDAPYAPLPLDYPDGENRVGTAETVSSWLTEEETRSLLQEAPSAYRTRINDVLLTALVEPFKAVTGVRRVRVDLEGHGREDLFEGVDLSRTVGWFTSLYPVDLSVAEGADLGEALKSVKEQLRSIPSNGIGYGVLRYLSEEGAGLGEIPAAPLSFNYLGQFDQALREGSLYGPARESAGAVESLSGWRSHLLEVSGIVVRGRLRMDWTYSRALHCPERIERLAEGYQQALRALISHCLSPEAGGYTPSDFPQAKLSQKDLDLVISEIA